MQGNDHEIILNFT